MNPCLASRLAQLLPQLPVVADTVQHAQRVWPQPLDPRRGAATVALAQDLLGGSGIDHGDGKALGAAQQCR